MAMAHNGWQQQLEEGGYAVVEGVLSGAECSALEGGFWEHFGRLAGVRKDDTATWKNIYTLFPSHGMLFQHWGVGHMQQIWDVRQNEKVCGVFESIWGTPELTVSFDGGSFGLQPEVTGRGWHRGDWLHLDQTSTSEFKCVQGWVTALDVGAGDATLTVLAGSHRLHAEFAAAFNLKGDKAFRKDWFKLGPEHIAWYTDKGCVQQHVQCPKGSMVLWDSRTVHAGRSPSKGRAEPKNRVVCYISMLPRSMLSDANREKKKNAALRGRTTSHWPAGRVKLFGKWPRTYGAPLPAVPAPEAPYLTPAAARLAGWREGETCPLSVVDAAERAAAVAAVVDEQDTEAARKKEATRKRKAACLGAEK